MIELLNNAKGRFDVLDTHVLEAEAVVLLVKGGFNLQDLK